MESVVFDQTPLAEYLKDEGEGEPLEWMPAAAASTASDEIGAGGRGDANVDAFADAGPGVGAGTATPVTPAHQLLSRPQGAAADTPPPSPPSPTFAPVGRPMVRKRFRNKIPSPLSVDARRQPSMGSRYSSVITSTISRADNAQFIEQFRYTIITSHLLEPSTVGQHHGSRLSNDYSAAASRPGLDAQVVPSMTGVVVAVAAAFVLSWAVNWVYSGGIVHLTKKRFFFGLVVFAVAVVVAHAYIRQQWLRYVRMSALTEVKNFVALSHDFDSAASAGIAFIKEVELVSRGYRISVPLPPISRIDDRNQSRRCIRLRKAIRGVLAEALPKYTQTMNVVKGIAEPLDLEMYHHVYDISDFDVSDALQGYSEAEFDDPDALRTLTIVAARFHTIRRMFLCAQLALEARGDESDFLRWTTAVEGLRTLNEITAHGYDRLRAILGEAETFPQLPPASPRAPLSPGRERWRSQLGKLSSLSSGIRGLQAKLALLREESDSTLNEADDISQLGPNLMAQYESIGQDLHMLVQAWEEGKSALASGIDRNEKRLSSLSAVLLSPTLSLSGLTTVDESNNSGTAEDALRALTGESPEPQEEIVFEALSLPPASQRLKSALSREERLAKMKEERERRAEAREQAEANRGMLRELEMVINLRPKGRISAELGVTAAAAPTAAAVPAPTVPEVTTEYSKETTEASTEAS